MLHAVLLSLVAATALPQYDFDIAAGDFDSVWQVLAIQTNWRCAWAVVAKPPIRVSTHAVLGRMSCPQALALMFSGVARYQLLDDYGERLQLYTQTYTEPVSTVVVKSKKARHPATAHRSPTQDQSPAQRPCTCTDIPGARWCREPDNHLLGAPWCEGSPP
jgi:hypothetical protein